MMYRTQKIKVLRGALEVLDGGKRWIQNGYHRDGSFCLAGAMFESALRLGLIEKVENEEDGYTYTEYVDKVYGGKDDEIGSLADRYTDESSLTKLAQEKGFGSVPKLNDSSFTTYRQIEELVNERIALLEQEGRENK